MKLSIQNLNKAYGTDVILKDISFHLEDHEKAAIIGINGAGKSTLFKIITGNEEMDSGDIYISVGTRIGYLAQYQEIKSSNSIYEELLDARKDLIELEKTIHAMESEIAEGHTDSAYMEQYTALCTRFENENGYSLKSEIIGILKGLGFEESEFDHRIDTLSGGQKTRVALGKLLLSDSDLLLLDEPINHLDLNSIIWLENYLRSYRGAVLIVAHDRYFLDRTVTKVIEIENGSAAVYSGNYSAYAEKKKQRRLEQMKAYLKQQQEIKHQEEVITKLKSFNREKSIKRAESREKALNRITRIEKPRDIHDEMHIVLEPYFISGNDVLTVQGLSKSYPGNPLFADIDFEIQRGEHVALIGDNGTGKTTMLKILNGLIPSDRGDFFLGSNVEIGYYDQEQQVLDPGKTLFEEISDAYPYLDNTDIRSTLAAFLFTGDDVFKMIGDLSGGERGRVSLAKLMLSEANFLILDEPTNHLDMVSKEILEQAINSYTGTVLYVSHDRYFINHTAHRILELDSCRIMNYIGNYDYYLEKKDVIHRSAGIDDIKNTDKQKISDNKKEWLSKKEEQARIRKIQAMIKKIESEIDKLEKRNTEIDQELLDPMIATNVSKCITLSQEKEMIASRLEELMEQWEAIQ